MATPKRPQPPRPAGAPKPQGSCKHRNCVRTGYRAYAGLCTQCWYSDDRKHCDRCMRALDAKAMP